MKNYFIVSILIFLLIISVVFIKKPFKKYKPEKVIISVNSMISVVTKFFFNFSKPKISTLSKEDSNMNTKKGYNIYYTLDGSVPSRFDTKYNKKIILNKEGKTEDNEFSKATILRAVSIAPDGVAGPVETRTFFLGDNIYNKYPNIPIFSLVTDPKNLFDNEIGIMNENNINKKGKDWERELFIELFDGKNNPSFSENAGIRIKGSVSRMYPQKSFNIYFRDDYGNKKLKYKLFEDNKDINGNVIKEYKSFTLRNGGNDTEFLKYKDQWLQQLVRDRNVDTQSGNASIVFLNGEYFGVYNLQEKYSDKYYAEHYDLDKDNIVVIKEDEVEEGKAKDIKLYEELMDYTNKDLSDDKTYNEFLELVDIESMLDYYAIEIYIGNADWGRTKEDKDLHNTQLWRSRNNEDSKYGDCKWRWSLYDLEYSSSLYNQVETNYAFNSIDRAINSQPLFASAMKNERFKKDFYERLRDIGSNDFNIEKVKNTLDEYENKWKPLVMEYYKKFGVNESASLIYEYPRNAEYIRSSSVEGIKNFFENRYRIITDY